MNENKGTRNKVVQVKKYIIIVSILVLLSASLTGCGGKLLARTMIHQLEELNPTSYSDIRGWVRNEMPEFLEGLENLSVSIFASDTNGSLIGEEFLEDERRFVEWNFDVGESNLTINLIYLTFGEVIERRLSDVDRESLTEIEEWIREVETEDELEVQVAIVDGNGNVQHNFDLQYGRDFFVGWDFSIREFAGTYFVHIDYIINMTRTVSLGEAFVLAGMQFTFEDNITAGRVDNYWSPDDGQPYINVPVALENVSDVRIASFPFNISEFGPDGIELGRFVAGGQDPIRTTGTLQPGGTSRRYISFRYDGDGDYTFIVTSRGRDVPFTINVIVPIYDLYIPDEVDRYNREVPIPAVTYDLPNLTLFNHNLSRGSFFYTFRYTSDLGNVYMKLEPNDIVRDPPGVITHDSLRLGYDIREINPEQDTDAVVIMERLAEWLQQGGNPSILIGDIRATEDRMTALLQTRRGVGGDLHTRLWVIQMFPDNNEFVIFETWLWTTTEATLEGERRASIEEFGELTGIDFIGILRETYTVR